MRCKGCNRDIEVKWYHPEGASEPILEDLCSFCKHWASCTLRAISATEEDPPVYWPEKVALGGELMLAPEDRPPHSGRHKVDVEKGFGAFLRRTPDSGVDDGEAEG